MGPSQRCCRDVGEEAESCNGVSEGYQLCRAGFQEELRLSGPTAGRREKKARQIAQVDRIALAERHTEIEELKLKVQPRR